MEPTDPRVAALYDMDNPDGPNHEHYRRRADRLDPKAIVDLGCGTGILTVTFARAGRSVLGIDPDWQGESARHARNTPSGRLTEWLDVSDPDEDGAVVLTAHNVFADAGEDVIIVQPLTFRSLEQVESDLAAAGLSTTNVWGGWENEPFEDTSSLIVIEATKQRRNPPYPGHFPSSLLQRDTHGSSLCGPGSPAQDRRVPACRLGP